MAGGVIRPLIVMVLLLAPSIATAQDAGYGISVVDPAPAFDDKRQLPQTGSTEAEAKRLAEELAKQKAEQARLKLEADRQLATEAAAKAKAEAEVQRLAEEARKLKADQEKLRAEAEAKQLADAAEKKQAQEQRLKAETEKLQAEAKAKALAEEVARKKAEQDKLRAEAEAKTLAEQAALKKAEQEKLRADAAAKSLAEQAALKKAEQDKLRAEAEAKTLAERAARNQAELDKLRAEAEAKKQAEQAALKKAEEDKLQGEAEAKRLAEEAARNKAEQEKLRAEAEAKQQAEETAQRTAAEQKLRAEDEAKRAADEAAATAAAEAEACSQPGSYTVDPAPLKGGRMRLAISSPCRAGSDVTVAYGPYRFVYTLDANGSTEAILDLFLGTGIESAVVFADGPSVPVKAEATDLDQISKVALTWRDPINLDLHALEYSAKPASVGDIWADQPLSAEAAADLTADGRGHGFLTSGLGAPGKGDQAEVYTLFHSDKQSSGIVSFLVDYASRGSSPTGETCGEGKYAAIGFEILRLSKGQPSPSERISYAPVPCGKDLSEQDRFSRYQISELRPRH